MNWQVKGRGRERWGNLTDDDLEMIAGKRDQLIGRLQERYAWACEEAERQADAFAAGVAAGSRAATK
jgi:uncharacterized protein YjbJ (UPF0337 family)